MHFVTGIALASFRLTMPSRIEALKMAQIGPESWVQKSRRIQFGNPCGPGILLYVDRGGLINTELTQREVGDAGGVDRIRQRVQSSVNVPGKLVEVVSQFVYITAT